MNYLAHKDHSWCEAYRMIETERLKAQTPDLDQILDRQRLISLCREAIERHWAKQDPRVVDRMTTLFNLRLVEERTLDECGSVLDVTRERVRQMETKLIRVVREHLYRLGVMS
jgi:DNA-directed RNA polymerase sigma subunit (sigma70/sigma32)